ncbi:GGDEF domain-containing protein [Streptomyces sp. H10-C2]|uniref:GGDEF domain-containing protein n=1 Tax=unclassified Streptomyces TaxID=2593676 RepID=UPI0024B8ABFF|nr:MULTISPECIES: GGDEF domain-containing protein [unclassified Streptomyces]MDJ0346382.1 GGDEF domain-containing protein [Streptomyces sp. PH10-H1]MDJ0374928.1 GGDEF domain-containing protein [Streptomyces sp. H10-C2]
MIAVSNVPVGLAPTAVRQRRLLLITATALPTIAAWALDHHRLGTQLAAARRDPLTGLPTRDEFTTRATQLADRHPAESVLLIADLDFFKDTNDAFGHGAGDAVLAAIGRRLQGWTGQHHGVAGRIGGDEFVAAARLQPAATMTALTDLQHALTRPVSWDGQHLPVAVSIGAAQTRDSDFAQAMRAADTAMYATKHTGAPRLWAPYDTPAPSVNGRRQGRRGTHLDPAAVAAPAGRTPADD